MNARILVTYASQTGATASLAEAIGKTLSEHGLQVDVRPMCEVADVAPYRAVVAGSAIHGRKWLPEALGWVRANRAALARVDFAAFLVCITLGMAKAEEYRSGVSTWLQPVRNLVRPCSEGLFAGRLDLEHLPFSKDGLGLRIAVALGALPKGDHRDWDRVRAWADSLAGRWA